MASRLDFKTVTTEDIPLIWSYLQQEKGRTTDFSFGGFFMWIDYFRYKFCIVDDTLFVKGVLEDDREKVAFSMPVGKMSPQQWLDEIRQYCKEHDLVAEFSAVPAGALDMFRSLAPKEISLLEGWGDYLYDAELMSTFAGKKMSKKRGHVNHFMAEYDGRWSLEKLSAANAQEVEAFMEEMDEEGDTSLSARAERLMTRRMLRLFDVYSPWIDGVVLKIDGRVEAFSIGDVKDDTLFVHVEKASRHISGSFETIAKLFAETMVSEHPEIRFVNREDDAGDEGLRRSKESFHPIEILEKYNILF